MLSDFHFLSPEWFFALLPLAAILWGIGRRRAGAGAWQRVVDPGLLPHLLVQDGGKARWLPLSLLATGWLTAVLALADPTFERVPVPAYRGELARLVLLDLSRSMETPDLKPSRLARARYKVADILERSRDGQVGLIAFAGDAFVVSPLTDDADTVLSLLDAVTPEIMPVQGSRPDLAIAKAAELLSRAGTSHGEVVLVGDDADGEKAREQAKALAAAGHRLSVIGVGTEEGAPIPGVRGNDQRPVLSRLDVDAMKSLARAGQGVYASLTADGSDLDLTLQGTTDLTDRGLSEDTMETEVWRELGPWVLLALLPLGALAFRRGWILVLALSLASGLVTPEPAMAFSWDDLWQRRDQQAAAALERGEHERALDLAEQPQQRGTASYRLGDYEAAADAFAGVDRPDGHYNRGNALARAGRLEEAIAAYDEALGMDPEMEDAAYNKALIEELLKQQQQQQQQQSQSDGEREGDQSEGQQSRDQPRGDESQSDQSSGNGSQQESSEGRSQQGERGDADDHGETGADQQGQADRKQESGEEGGASGEEEEQPDSEPSDSDAESTGTRRDQPTDNGSNTESGDESNVAEPEDPQETEQAAADYREEAAKHSSEQALEASAPPRGEPNPQEREAQQAANQWLRRIPDDPAGLLRRKFLYQYRSRATQEGTTVSGNPW